MKKRTLLALLLCIIFLNSTAYATQVRKRNAYVTYADAKNRMVTSYYLVNDNGSRISTQEYDYLEKVNANLFIALNNDKYGILDGRGIIKVPFEYEEIKCFKSWVFRIKEKGKFGLMDYNGNVFIKPYYSYLEKIDDRLIKMSKGTVNTDSTAQSSSGGNIGIMNYSGKVIASEKYIYVDKINNYMLRVILGAENNASVAPADPTQPNATLANGNSGGKKYGLIDYYGRTILSPQYDYLAKVSNTILKVKKGSSWGRIEYYNGNILNIMLDYQSYW